VRKSTSPKDRATFLIAVLSDVVHAWRGLAAFLVFACGVSYWNFSNAATRQEDP
jgi:hypothetical protein